jgi:hypothetical protein
MTAFVSGADVSTAWLAGARHLLAQPDGQASNLGVSIANPIAERPELRRELEAFAMELSRRGREVPRIESVAGTIFPSSFYRPRAADPETHLYDLEQRIRAVVRKHRQNRGGTYFERLVAYPVGNGQTMNQLHHVIERLRSASRSGRRNGNQYELALFHPERDTYPVGFPCLSHVSITLINGRLDATAVYRNQYFVGRAYGNYLGLGEVLRFLATESGFAVGELLCVASHAKLEIGTYGRSRVEALVDRCTAQLGGDTA